MLETNKRKRPLSRDKPKPFKRDSLNRQYLPAVAAFITLGISTAFWLAWRNLITLGSDAALGARLSKADAAEMGARASPHYAMVPGNPWRGAGRRVRRDLLVAVSGCGGSYRPAARYGDRVAILFVARDAAGLVVDSTRKRGAVDAVLGAGQVPGEVERTLLGMCAGEAVPVYTRGRLQYMVMIEKVGLPPPPDSEEEEDMLAVGLHAIPARLNRSCRMTCRREGLVCREAALRIVNTCPRLREAFNCSTCEVAAAGSSGADMPCYVSLAAPAGFPRGFCMVNPKLETSTCDARFVHTRRLCPCTKS